MTDVDQNELDFISQDDIDSLLSEPEAEESERAAGDEVASADEGGAGNAPDTDGDVSGLDQSVIDSLLDETGGDDAAETPEEGDASGLDQSVIDSLLDETGGDDTADASGEGDVSGLDQSAIDSLLDETDGDDTADASGEGDVSGLDQSVIDNLLDDDGGNDETEAEGEAGVISQDDIDSLLSDPEADESDGATGDEAGQADGAGGSDTPGSGGEESSLDQSDIDSLLGDSGGDGDDDSEIEEVLEEVGDSGVDADGTIDGGTEDVSDQVILEDVEEEDDEEDDEPEPAKGRWGLKKLMLVASPVVLILLGGIGYVLFFHLNKPDDAGPAPMQAASIDNKKEVAPEVGPVKVLKEVVNLDGPASVQAPAAHFIALKGFLVPTPLKRKDLTYVTADISIELTSSHATRLIKDHVAFYRNVIYDVLKQALTARDKSKINEISLKIAILKVLNDALPERSVKDVIVDTFFMF